MTADLARGIAIVCNAMRPIRSEAMTTHICKQSLCGGRAAGRQLPLLALYLATLSRSLLCLELSVRVC